MHQRIHRILLLAFIGLFLFSAVVTAGASATSYQGMTLQTTPYGMVDGLRNDRAHTLSWLGVPYAKPPVGELRWKAPRPPESWESVLQTKAFGDKSAQLSGAKLSGSEDCLYLNIWRPDSLAKDLPVLVFVHGGGNFVGAGDSFNGEQLASRTQSLVISINYRLGAMGWLNYSALKTGDPLDDSGNYGLLDIIQALKWVQHCIASFGGNPGNVTISGQSAGARNVLALLISPLSEGLFHKAVCLSGGLTLAEPALGESYAQAYVKNTLIQSGKTANETDAAEWLASHTPAEISQFLRALDTRSTIPARPANIRMKPFPHLFRDGHVIPADGFAAVSRGAYQRVPLILGSTANEFAYYMATEPYFNPGVRELSILRQPGKLRVYLDAVHFGGELFAGLALERVAETFAAGQGQPDIYGYRFAWGMREGVLPSPLNRMLGAAHASDVDFLTAKEDFPFKTLFKNLYYTPDNKPGREALSLAMTAYVGNFMHAGNPNAPGLATWNPWKIDQPRVMRLDADARQALVAMSREYYQKEAILREMKQALPEAEYQLLTKNLFASRFFWEY